VAPRLHDPASRTGAATAALSPAHEVAAAGSSPKSAAPLDSDELLREVIGMAPRAAPAALARGQVVDGAYRIEDELGSGGMGRVYRAHDLRLGRDVAIKLHTAVASEPGGARLLREAAALARLAHPNVVTVFEVGTWSGHPWVAMEYVPGGTARTWLAAAPRRPAEILAVYTAAARGLAAAHAAGLVHRDFKPDNVLVAEGRVRVADFGLAVSTAEAGRGSDGDSAARAPGPALATVTCAGAIMGTPAYMAPEQWAGARVGPPADQFALAVALWEALTGARPFEPPCEPGSEPAAPAPAPRPVRAGQMPRHVERALRRALAHDPAARWPHLDALIAALARDPAQPRRRAAAATAIATGAAIAIAAASTRGDRPAQDPGSACALASADEAALRAAVLPDGLVAAAAAAAAVGAGPEAATRARRIGGIAAAFRADYGARARAGCRAIAEGAWPSPLAAAHRECLAYHASVARELVAAAPGAASSASDVTQIVLALPGLAPCVDPRRLAGWRPVASTPTALAELTAAHARLEAALTLLEQGRVARARALYQEVAARSARTSQPLARRLRLVAGALAAAADDPRAAESQLADVYFEARAADDGPLALAAVRQILALIGVTRGDPSAAQRWIADGIAEAERQRASAPEAAAAVLLAAASALAGAGESARVLELLARAEELATPAEGVRLEVSALRSAALANAGELREAASVAAAQLRGVREWLGPDHPAVGQTLARHAALLLGLGRAAEARAAAREASRLLAGAADELQPRLASAAIDVGATLLALGDPTARDHLERTRRAIVTASGSSHPQLARIDELLARRRALAARDPAEP
jgi:tetratricopeptide (TPR) repeat protein